MKINYRTQGTCSSNIEIEVENDIITDVHFTGGCNGNLKGISFSCQRNESRRCNQPVGRNSLRQQIYFLPRSVMQGIACHESIIHSNLQL